MRKINMTPNNAKPEVDKGRKFHCVVAYGFVENEDFFVEYVRENMMKLNTTRNIWTQIKIAFKKHNIGLYKTLSGSVLCCGHYAVIKEKNKVNLHPVV